jgi:cytoskeletal protein CcmA (bactofilin family)
MVFRRDNKGGDAFQRQISQLRQQLGGSGGDQAEEGYQEDDRPVAEQQGYAPTPYSDQGYEDEGSAYGRGSYAGEYDYVEESTSAVDTYQPQAPVIPTAEPQMTVVSHNTVWKGEIDSEESMHIHGKFDGVIRAQQDVYILEEATVAAEVTAQNVVIAGRYDGEVTCRTRFEVLPTGRVQGTVRAPVLVVHEGAEINGSIQMTDAGSERQEPTSLVHRREAMGGTS